MLERIAKLAGRQPQRIGLSATIGNPEEILTWMTRKLSTDSRVLSPTAAVSVAADIQLDYVGSIENAAHVVAQLQADRRNPAKRTGTRKQRNEHAGRKRGPTRQDRSTR